MQKILMHLGGHFEYCEVCISAKSLHVDHTNDLSCSNYTLLYVKLA